MYFIFPYENGEQGKVLKVYLLTARGYRVGLIQGTESRGLGFTSKQRD